MYPIYFNIYQHLGEGERIAIMHSSASKKTQKQQNHQRQTRSAKEAEQDPAPAILSAWKLDQRAKHSTAMMAQTGGSEEASVEQETAEEQLMAVDTDAITRPILEAINTNKSELMGRIDHLPSECMLIRHDLGKIRGRLTTVEDRVSGVEDTSHTQGIHLAELRDLVKSLQHRADDAEDRQRRNNIRVVSLPEGAEGERPVQFAEALFKKLLSLEDLPPTYVVERAHRVPTGRKPPGAC